MLLVRTVTGRKFRSVTGTLRKTVTGTDGDGTEIRLRNGRNYVTDTDGYGESVTKISVKKQISLAVYVIIIFLAF